MKMIKVEEAVGHVLCHDMTRIIPGEFKGVAFKKGHVVTEEDIPVLLSMGKENLYVWEKEEGKLHEDEAALRLGKICMDENMSGSDIREGKINIFAQVDGVLKINVDKLKEINALDEIMIATIHRDFPVKKGDKLAATRVIPLIIDEDKVEEAEAIAGKESLLSIQPYKKYRIGIVTTGSEVFHGRIQDAFGPVIRKKAAEYDMEVIEQIIVDDEKEDIKKAIQTLIDKGATMVVCTGGMSVDPDDLTPTAIKEAGADIISYGAPALPGAMFLLAYNGDMPILGLPGCVMYAKRTVFDLIFPRVLTGEKIDVNDLAKYGHGGLCLDCPECTFPACSFGKGW